ncbi:hypothetical protein PHMEG_00030645 [Phytophthora megakarya]|uniref:Transmembrane protein n=1 Tax=Phytophthora megakarya TaxID=4795 RepID=A0A225UZU9_9STRA|nr:hypothetical protein PHMEG_00030645 [Phytophthora megakarya]
MFWNLRVLWFQVFSNAEVHPVAWAVLGVSTWVLTTPIRSVVWILLESFWSSAVAVGFFFYTCVDRYFTVIQSERMTALSSTDYAWSAVALSFVIPIAVLEDYQDQFGIFGCMWRMWCMASHHTIFIFCPNAAESFWGAVWRYGAAFARASVYVGHRVCDVVYGAYVFGLLVASVVAHGPRILYDVLEGLLHGSTGVMVALLIWNTWQEFSFEALVLSACVMVCGLYSRLLKSYAVPVSTGAPKRVINKGLSSMKERVKTRTKEEQASLDRLRGRSGQVQRADKSVTPVNGSSTTDEPELITVTIDQGVPDTAPPALQKQPCRCWGQQREVGENCPESALAAL